MLTTIVSGSDRRGEINHEMAGARTPRSVSVESRSRRCCCIIPLDFSCMLALGLSDVFLILIATRINSLSLITLSLTSRNTFTLTLADCAIKPDTINIHILRCKLFHTNTRVCI